jgi:hypothetical protein
LSRTRLFSFIDRRIIGEVKKRLKRFPVSSRRGNWKLPARHRHGTADGGRWLVLPDRARRQSQLAVGCSAPDGQRGVARVAKWATTPVSHGELP